MYLKERCNQLLSLPFICQKLFFFLMFATGNVGAVLFQEYNRCDTTERHFSPWLSCKLKHERLTETSARWTSGWDWRESQTASHAECLCRSVYIPFLQRFTLRMRWLESVQKRTQYIGKEGWKLLFTMFGCWLKWCNDKTLNSLTLCKPRTWPCLTAISDLLENI